MSKGSLSELDLLEGPLWSMIPSDNMLMSVVHAASQTDKTWKPCGLLQSVPLMDALVMSLGFSVLGSHFDGSGLYNYLRPC